nr:MAG TPA: hypothetical protein [Caudoviricetes sp.]
MDYPWYNHVGTAAHRNPCACAHQPKRRMTQARYNGVAG